MIAVVVLVMDALATWAVAATLALGERRELVPQLLVLTHVRNTGAAYGLLTGQRWLLVTLSVVIIVVTPLLLRTLPRAGRWAWAAPVLTGMVLGGALGNLAERAWAGYVTDFLTMPAIPLFRVFNLSDVSISLAVTALVVLSLTEADRSLPVPSRKLR